MKVLFFCIFFLFAFMVNAQSQSEPAKDTADYPYWIEMMSHPGINLFQIQRAFNLYWKDRPITKGCGYKVFKRWEYMAKLHSDEHGNISMPLPVSDKGSVITKDPFSEVGFENMASFDSTMSCYNDSFWIELGPKNMGDVGRINAIAFHPTDSSIMLSGAASGGLWKTKDGGANWFLVTDKLPTLGVSAIAYDYSDPNIIYIGTGDKAGDASGFGVFKSIDAGETWFPVNNNSQSTATVVKIVIDPVNPNIVLIAANQSVFRSIDKGKTWKYSSASVSSGISDLVINEAYRNIVYMCSGGSFYKSIDSGKSFNKVVKGMIGYGNFSSIAYARSDSSCVYFLLCYNESYVGLFRSLNFGDSFVRMSYSPNIMGYLSDGSDNGGQAWYCRDIAVHPSKRDEVYVGGINIWKSANGGQTWAIIGHWKGDNAPYLHADIHSLEFTKGGKLYATNDGGVYKHSNGNTWAYCSNGLGVRQTYKISTCKEGWLLSGFQDNGSAVAPNLDSKYFSGITGGDGMDNYIDKKDPNMLYTSIQEGQIYRNGYLLAANGTNGVNEYGDWITPFTLQENNSNVMLAGFYNIWKSSNLNSGTAISFKNICDANSYSSGSFVFDVESSPAKNDIFYFTRANGTIYKTSNLNGSTPSWVNLSANKPQTGLIRDVQCHYKDTSIVYVAIESKVYKSFNGGKSWVNYSGNLPDPYLVVYSLAIDSSDKNEALYCGTSSGVYYTDTLLKKWIRFKTSLPDNVKVLDIEISFGKNRKSSSRLFAGTYGRGIWSTPLKNFKEEKPFAKIGILGLKDYFSDYVYDFNRVCPGGRMVFYDSSEGIGIKHKWFVTPNKGVTFENNDSTGVKAAIFFGLPGKYKITKVVKNCIGTDTASYEDFIVFDNSVKSACHGTTTQVSSAGDFGITNLRINGLNGSCKTTRLGGEYQDNYCKYIFKVKPQTKYRFFSDVNNLVKEYFKVYIDYNNDGTFSETDELIKIAYFKGIIMDSLYISGKSVKNKLLRMRLISDYLPIDTNACPTLLFGHAVDFGIVIEAEDHYGFKSDINITCINSTVKYSDTSTGINTSYLWNFGKDSKPSTASGIGPHNVSYTSSGYKTVQLIIDGKHQIRTDSMVLINPIFRNKIVQKGSDSVLCPGDALFLQSELDSLSDYYYSWKRNGLDLNVSSKNLGISKVVLKDSGTYFLLTRNICYTDTSNVLLIDVKSLPNALFQSAFIANYIYSFKPIVSTYKKYLWGFGDGKSDNSNSPSHDFQGPGKYRVTLVATSVNDCIDSNAVLVDVKKNTGIVEATFERMSITPNPVLNNINISFDTKEASDVKVDILYPDGRIIANVYNGYFEDLHFNWSGDLHHFGLSPGVYLVSIRVKGQNQVYKIILM